MGSKGQEGTQGCNIIRAIIGALCGCVRGDRQAHHIYFQSSNPKFLSNDTQLCPVSHVSHCI